MINIEFTILSSLQDECVRLSDEVIASFEKDALLEISPSYDSHCVDLSQTRPMYSEIKPPLAMFERIKYSRMHVFVSGYLIWHIVYNAECSVCNGVVFIRVYLFIRLLHKSILGNRFVLKSKIIV